MLGFFEILARNSAFHPSNDELDAPLDVRHFRRQRRLAQLYARTGFIEKIDGLVWKKPIWNVPIRKINCAFDGLVGVIDEVKLFVTRLDSLEDTNRFALA